MRNYSVLYGKLSACRDRFLCLDDLNRLREENDWNVLLSILSKRLEISLEGNVSPMEVRKKIIERFLEKINIMRLYLPASAADVLSFLLYKYDIYNLKVLLALHFSHRDVEVSKFVYRKTLLYPRYAFLVDREVIVDKDILLAFRNTPIFPFLADTYRFYKEKSDLFFLDTVLEDGYYQTLLKMVSREKGKDRLLLDVLRYILFVHNVLWGMRLKYVYGFQWGQIYYYLVLPLSQTPTELIMDLFSPSHIDGFISKLQQLLPLFYKLGLNVDEIKGSLEDIEDILIDSLIKFLWKESKKAMINSLSAIVAWMFCQDMLLDEVEKILYKRWIISEGWVRENGINSSR